MASKKYDILVIGGGTGGLVLALTLAQKGFQVAILDRQTHPMPLPRGEILQPNGLKILDHLGLLNALLKTDVHLNKKVHFYQTSGTHLCTVDYSTLPAPYNYSLILLPEVLQKILLEEVDSTPNIHTHWGTSFESLTWQGTQVTGLTATQNGRTINFKCSILVGSDGAASKVRNALQLPYQAHVYKGGYVTMLVDRPQGFENDARYYLGKEQIFGAFPVSKNKIYLFYLLPTDKLAAVKKHGLQGFKTEMLSLHPEIAALFSEPLHAISSWDQTAYMRCFRVRCRSWVNHGAALLGDAAHAMNPHIAQGRNAAMDDACVLAETIEHCFRTNDFSQEALKHYEQNRRKDIKILQGLGDEMVFFWNAGAPPLVWLRDRVFKKVQQRQHLHDKLLRTVAGLQLKRFNLQDRWHAIRP
ncbi:monooxygenase, FAD-binding [hydrothermal vent metagenome]|uniref:Monooxygenase, FAD-binding n=1 Tax=hydrothermal vent metagenome TaxID=652676 RepID=A0A3B1CP06_9ZZZZ